MSNPATLKREISPPPLAKRKPCIEEHGSKQGHTQQGSGYYPSLAAIEAGEAKIKDHLEYFSKHLARFIRPGQRSEKRLPISEFRHLYERNQHPNGRHFVVQQHNHPIAGTHYDLRLQFSRTSSISFAIPYGLPGNPNSKRSGRMAIETRVHTLWNHLIESASHATGSMLIWDTGEYSILPRKRKRTSPQTDDEHSNTSDPTSSQPTRNRSNAFLENEKLISAFRDRYIRLCLHGTRLPRNYTLTLRLPFANNHGPQPVQPRRKRRRKANWVTTPASSSTESGEDEMRSPPQRGGIDDANDEDAAAAASDDTGDEEEALRIRATNAYTGATNSIGSVHQRHWFVLLDKPSSGFVRAGKGRWVRAPIPGGEGREDEERDGFEPFFVLGAEGERSVVTGRTSGEVMADEGVQGFRARRMWRPVLE